jgi:colanic acid/amylovoran biosynthesis protein
MRILIDPGTYDYTNMGCVSVIQVAVGRFRRLCPTCQVQVFTRDPDNLMRHCPDALPMMIDGHRAWFSDQYLLGRIHQHLPTPVSRGLIRLKRGLRDQSPCVLEAMIRARMRLGRRDTKPLTAFFEAIERADLVVTSGLAGIRTSEWHPVSTLEMAVRRGKPTAMFSLGLSSAYDPGCLKRIQALLPRVNLVALREKLVGPKLLAAHDIRPKAMTITGDDAVGLAFEARPDRLGSGIGVNVSARTSAEVDENDIQRIRLVLQAFARTHRATLIPLPSANERVFKDSTLIRQVLAGYADCVDGGEHLDTPMKVIRETGRCRIVVTGAYHVAVFSLAQGIPAILLAKSRYFTDKLRALADMFGSGAEVVSLGDENFTTMLASALEKTWNAAETLREHLLQAATQQNEMSWAAYRRAIALVQENRVTVEARGIAMGDALSSGTS